MGDRVGEKFQQGTRYTRDTMDNTPLDWANQPESWKLYPDAPRVPLETPRIRGGVSLWSALNERRSVRRFGGATVTKRELSRLLWAAQGVTRQQQGVLFRTAPSAGGLYPIETYLAVHRVEGVESGIYHYAVPEHALEQLSLGDVRLATAQAALDQRIAYEADLVLIWTAIFQRSKWKYKQRAYRYIYLDAGHIAQNVALAAVALGLGSCQIAAIYDDEANGLLGLDGGQESVIYMTSVGREG